LILTGWAVPEIAEGVLVSRRLSRDARRSEQQRHAFCRTPPDLARLEVEVNLDKQAPRQL
jgi:hypothetical protein